MGVEKTVVLGAGFLGVNTALNLSKEEEVVLIDENLSHEYVPGTIDLLRGESRQRRTGERPG